MPTQAEIDFEPIKSAFPRSVMDGEGLPCILSSLTDPDKTIQWLVEDDLTLQFETEGGFTLSIDTTGMPVLTLSLDQVEKIAARARKADALFKDWQASPTGKAWVEKHAS